MKNYFDYIWRYAAHKNVDNIISLLETKKNANVIDIGCGDGYFSKLFKSKIKCKTISGTDGVSNKLKIAKKNGVTKTYCIDLEKKWSLKTSEYDVVISNQVFEHILNLDRFISEIHRILKPGGYCVISTENLSSWHNIFALILGFQDFSHHLIRKKHVGNPFALHKGEKTGTWTIDSEFPHIKIPTYRSFRKVFETYGFKYEKGLGSGYHPLPPRIAYYFSKIDPYHAHFISLKFRKL